MKQVKFFFVTLLVLCMISCSNKTNENSNSTSTTTDRIEKTKNSEANELIKCNDTLSKLVFEPTYVAGEGPCDSGFTHRLITLANCVTIRGIVEDVGTPVGDGDLDFYLELGAGYEKILNEINPKGPYAKFRELVCPIKSKQKIHCEIIWAGRPDKGSVAYYFYINNHLENWKNPIPIPINGDSVELTGRFVIDLSYENKTDPKLRCFRPEYEIHPITKLTNIVKHSR